MKNLNDPTLTSWRRRDLERAGYGREGDGFGGVFSVRPAGRDMLRVIAANDAGWDHVSVSLVNRCPTWAEMEFVKRRFFNDDETAFQLHVPPVAHISLHPHCLHIWRPHDAPIPLPPSWMVGY